MKFIKSIRGTVKMMTMYSPSKRSEPSFSPHNSNTVVTPLLKSLGRRAFVGWQFALLKAQNGEGNQEKLREMLKSNGKMRKH